MDLVASGVAYKERLKQPVVAEVVAREQPEHLREYLWSGCATTVNLVQLPTKKTRCVEMAESNGKSK